MQRHREAEGARGSLILLLCLDRPLKGHVCRFGPQLAVLVGESGGRLGVDEGTGSSAPFCFSICFLAVGKGVVPFVTLSFPGAPDTGSKVTGPVSHARNFRSCEPKPVFSLVILDLIVAGVCHSGDRKLLTQLLMLALSRCDFPLTYPFSQPLTFALVLFELVMGLKCRQR